MNGWIYLTSAPISWLRYLSPATPDPLARRGRESNKWRQVLQLYIGILDLLETTADGGRMDTHMGRNLG